MGKMLSATFHWDCYMLQMCALELAQHRQDEETASICEQNARDALDHHFDALESALELIGWARNG
jgi:hypothetical protein